MDQDDEPRVGAVYRPETHDFGVIDVDVCGPIMGELGQQVIQIDDGPPIQPPVARVCIVGPGATAPTDDRQRLKEYVAEIHTSNLKDREAVGELIRDLQIGRRKQAAASEPYVALDLVGLLEISGDVARLAARVAEATNTDIAIRLMR